MVSYMLVNGRFLIQERARLTHTAIQLLIVFFRLGISHIE